MENENLILQLAKIIVAQSKSTAQAPTSAPETPMVVKEVVDLKKISKRDFNEELFRRYPNLKLKRKELAKLAGVDVNIFYHQKDKLERIPDKMSVRDAYLYLPACYSTNQLYTLIREKRIPYKNRTQSRYYFLRAEIDEWYSREGYALLAPTRTIGGAPVPPDELPAKDDLVSIACVCGLLKSHPSRNTIYRWVSKGMPHYYLGEALRFSKKEASEWFKQLVEGGLQLELSDELLHD